MRQILDKQQKQMVEDYQWLRQEEKSLVSSCWAEGGKGDMLCGTTEHVRVTTLAGEVCPCHRVGLCHLLPPELTAVSAVPAFLGILVLES